VLANIHRDEKKRRQPYTWQFFFGQEEPPRKQTTDEMLAFVEQLNSLFGGDDLREGTTPSS
jgi:hypothetical protein